MCSALRSRTVTSYPRRNAESAEDKPMMPFPMIKTRLVIPIANLSSCES